MLKNTKAKADIEELLGGETRLGSRKFRHLYGKEEQFEYAGKIRRETRKLVCTHPIEWDKKLFDKIKEEYDKCVFTGHQTVIQETNLKHSAEALDIWEGGLEKIFAKNELHFVHPIYFLNHLDRAGVFEFNPYEGYKRTFLKEEGTKPKEIGDHLDSGTIDVGYGSETNPGFAPLAAANPNTPSVEYGGVRYAGCSSPFNIRREGSSGSELRHTGIDLAPGGNTKIVSLTYGTVWAYTYDKNYGNVLIVKDDNKDILYFLAHLESSDCKVMQKVNPGYEVAVTGKTGNWGGTAVHLHLEVYECKSGSDEDAKNGVLDETKNKAPGTGADAELVWVNRSGFESGEKRNKVRRDAFNHTEKYKG